MTYTVFTRENKNKYREIFINWMDTNYPNIARPDIMYSNVMYSINNEIGFSINDLISEKITIKEYEDLYIRRFDEIKRKSPTGHAKVQVGCAKYFLEFARTL